MLTVEQKAIISQTVPVLEQYGTQITKVFYETMFNAHPELLNVFNKTNQSQGRQQTALAMTVLAAAKHIDNLAALLPQVEQIGHKHRALQILPEHYPIVGENLLKAIKIVLGDAATPAIIDAWAVAYQQIADIFIGVEQQMYQQASWQGFAPFRVVEKNITGSDIAVFSVIPVNGDSQPAIDLDKLKLVAGQYITVKTQPSGSENTALRHYSIVSIDASQGLQFAVRRDLGNDHEGLVSNYLHDAVQVGDEILLSAPAGDFVLASQLITQNTIPLVLISAGVGVTPVKAMLEQQLAQNPNRPIIWVYACQDSAHHAFAENIEALLAKGLNTQSHTFYSAEGERLTTAWLENLPNPADVYVCGSMNFMEQMIAGLLSLKHHNDSVHYEPFGPKMSLPVV